MNAVSLSPSEIWRFAIELTVVLLAVSAAAAAIASAMVVGLAGLIVDGVPKLKARLRPPIAAPIPSGTAGVP
jgi:hypothetical protein